MMPTSPFKLTTQKRHHCNIFFLVYFILLLIESSHDCFTLAQKPTQTKGETSNGSTTLLHGKLERKQKLPQSRSHQQPLSPRFLQKKKAKKSKSNKVKTKVSKSKNEKTTTTETTTTTTSTSSTSNTSVSGRIVGGDLVMPRDTYPWFVRLVYRNGSKLGCGGSLISAEYVLTAAHCVYPTTGWRASNAAVQIGAVCPYEDNNCNQPLEKIDVEEIIQHPKFKDRSIFDYDYALVKLKKRTSVTPVAMDQGQYVDQYDPNSTKRNLYAIGFGTLKASGEAAKQLRHVELAIVPLETCKLNYMNRFTVTDTMMCAADPGQDACQGDSGGPLYDKDNKALVGIVSWGIGCAESEYPGVYSQVSRQWNWIKRNLCPNHSTPKPDLCFLVPTVTPSTAPSTIPCEGLHVEIYILTDVWPRDTSWKVTNLQSGKEYTNTRSFTSKKTSFYEDLCLDPFSSYHFTLYDSYGDGLIPPANFQLKVNDDIVLTNPTGKRPKDYAFSRLDAEFGPYKSTLSPSAKPSTEPSLVPTVYLSTKPSLAPSNESYLSPSTKPSISSSLAPSNEIVSSLPTSIPSLTPSSSTSSSCVDTPLKLRFTNASGKKITIRCRWVARKRNQITSRCALIGISDLCPLSCGTCSACADPPGGLKFKVKIGDKYRLKNCDWVANKKANDIQNRCSLTGNICRATCGVC